MLPAALQTLEDCVIESVDIRPTVYKKIRRNWWRQLRLLQLGLCESAPRGAGTVLAVLLGACTLGPTVPAPVTGLPPSYESSQASGPATSVDRWWSLYDDPQLGELIDQALLQAPDARLAKARLTEAIAIRSEALADYAPQGGVAGSVSQVDTRALSGPAPVAIPGFGTISLTNSGAATEFWGSFNVSWELVDRPIQRIP